MRFHLVSRIALLVVPNENASITGANFFGVNFLEPLKGIDSDNDVASTGVWLAASVTLLQVVEKTSLHINSSHKERRKPKKRHDFAVSEYAN